MLLRCILLPSSLWLSHIPLFLCITFWSCFLFPLPCSYLGSLKGCVLRWTCGAWVLWEEGFLSLHIQARNCLVIWQLGFSVLRTLWSVLHVTLCTFQFLQQLHRLPTSPRSSPEFIAPGCLHDKHSDLVGNDTPGGKIQSLLNCYLCGYSFPGRF